MTDDNQLLNTTKGKGKTLLIRSGYGNREFVPEATRCIDVGKGPVTRQTCSVSIPIGRTDRSSLARKYIPLPNYMGAMNIANIASQLIRYDMASSLPVMAVSAKISARQRPVFSGPCQFSTSSQGLDADAPVPFAIGDVVFWGAAAAEKVGADA